MLWYFYFFHSFKLVGIIIECGRLHRYINFKFNEVGGKGGSCKKMVNQLNLSRKLVILLFFACFYTHFCIFLHVYRYFDKKLSGTIFWGFGKKTGTFEEYIPVGGLLLSRPSGQYLIILIFHSKIFWNSFISFKMNWLIFKINSSLKDYG